MITIDIWSDFACPFCWIGKHRLQAALAQLGPAFGPVSVRWRAFQLDPDASSGPVPLRQAYAAKFGGLERTEQLLANVQGQARADGLAMDFGQGQVKVNTLQAHRLVQLAAAEGDAQAVSEALFQAHFAHGRNLADLQVLTEAGWPVAFPPRGLRSGWPVSKACRNCAPNWPRGQRWGSPRCRLS